MLLTDAESYIDEFPFKDSGILRAVLELRRAELKLLRINEPLGADVGDKSWFREFRRALKTIPLREQTKTHLETLKAILAPLELKSIWPSLARINDAFRDLERAKFVLRQHPKNRWWWWVFCVIKMKATEYARVVRLVIELVHIRNFERQQGQPGNLLPSSPRPRVMPPDAINYYRHDLQASVANTGLDDCFQLARLLESYEGLLKMLRLQQLLPNQGPRLPEAIEEAEEVKRKLGDFLKTSLEKAKKLPPGRQIHPDVFQYASKVLEKKMQAT